MGLTLRTPRLLLRRFTADDLGALDAVFGDPEVMRFVGSRCAPWTAEEIRAALDRVDAHWEAHGYGTLAVVERADRGAPRRTGDTLLGECGLQLLEEGPDIELAYTFARSAWGRGYATEAATAVLGWGFATLGLTRVVGVTYPQNVASQRVLEKVGMRRQGLRHCYGADLVEFALNAADRAAVALVAATPAGGPAAGAAG